MLKEKKVVPKLRQEVKVKVDIVTSEDIKIYSTGKFQDFTDRYIINIIIIIVKMHRRDSLSFHMPEQCLCNNMHSCTK